MFSDYDYDFIFHFLLIHTNTQHIYSINNYYLIDVFVFQDITNIK